MSTMTGAALIVELLQRQGIEIIAGVPGGANLPLYDALSQSSIRHILARHEQGAGFIAQGMARVTGETAVCLATSGPGATNILTAIADAKLDSVPIVCITGQVPQAMVGTDAFQEIDTYGMSIPITKHNFFARSAEELLEIVPNAFRIAASGRPGPVLIDVPKDVQKQMITVTHWPEPGKADPLPEHTEDDITRAAAVINSAQRPILYIGGGIIASEACEAIRQLAEKANIPTTLTLMGLGALPTDHPLSIGMLGMHGPRYTNLAMARCDALIAIGVRFDDRATGIASKFCPDATIVHIDIDRSELDKIKPANVAITGDARKVLADLLLQVDPADHTQWLAEVGQLKADHPMLFPGSDDLLRPYGIIRAAAELSPDNAVVSTDVGQHQMWTAQAYPFGQPRQWLTSGGLGTMGFGLPAAIGAALAAPERTVLCFTGDGSLLMNIQELATAAETGVNVKVLLLDNAALGLVRQQQELFYGERYHGCKFPPATRFCEIAEGFGVPALDLGTVSKPRQLLADILSAPGPALIRIPIPELENVFPMVAPGAANTSMIGGENDANS